MTMTHVRTPELPIIDVASLVTGAGDQQAVAAEIGRAGREQGFFYVVGHGVSGDLQKSLERELSRRFFAQDLQTKLEIRMAYGGRAWRRIGNPNALSGFAHTTAGDE